MGEPMTHVVVGGPWPERLGLPCRIVPPLRDGYPWSPRRGLKGEVVIWIDNDPLNGLDEYVNLRDWTCCISEAHLRPLVPES